MKQRDHECKVSEWMLLCKRDKSQMCLLCRPERCPLRVQLFGEVSLLPIQDSFWHNNIHVLENVKVNKKFRIQQCSYFEAELEAEGQFLDFGVHRYSISSFGPMLLQYLTWQNLPVIEAYFFEIFFGTYEIEQGHCCYIWKSLFCREEKSDLPKI